MSSMTADADISEPHFAHAWRAKSGTVHATVYLNRSSTSALWFDAAADARSLIAEITKAAEGLERLEAESGTALPAEGEGGDGK